MIKSIYDVTRGSRIGGLLIPAVLASAYSLNANAAVTNGSGLSFVESTTPGVMEHCDAIVAGGSFLPIFDCGDELFEIRYNAVDGVGMDVGDGGRFTRVPRADLGNWQSATPMRTTGPNAEACNVCHLAETIGGAGDGGGPAALNVIRDPLHSGQPSMFIQRNVPHLFGMAGPQLVAEEMTEELHALRQSAIDACETDHQRVRVDLISKGINFGRLVVRPREDCAVKLRVKGVADDLVVRPFQWKGTTASVREFSRDAFHNEMGMDPVELTGDGVDGDYDGVVDEVSIADVTAMAIYLAAQPRPTTLLELDDLRAELEAEDSILGAALADEMHLPALTAAERADINSGEQVFDQIGCASCHTPSFTVSKTVFKEPSDNMHFRDNGQFPAGQSADIDQVSFNITNEMPDNQIEFGAVMRDLGNFETDANGDAIVRMYGDLKQHNMGHRLAENIDEAGNGESTWITKELWGLGNTAPYLHDGRASTIEEAILEHRGEANYTRKNFKNLAIGERQQLVAFLKNLVLFLPAEEE